MTPHSNQPGPRPSQRLAASAIAAVLVGVLVGGGASYFLVRHFSNTTPAPVIVRSSGGKGASNGSLTAILGSVEPGVVQVIREPVAPAAVTAADVGSGFVASSTGLIVTSEGAVAGASGVEIAFASGQLVAATIVAADPETGIVVLQAATSSLPAPLTFGTVPNVGDTAIAVSSPLGASTSVAVGTVSSVAMSVTIPDPAASGGSAVVDGVLRTDFSEPQGSGGGPLVDASGDVIGVLTGDTMLPEDQGSTAVASGFALDSDAAQTLVSGLVATGSAPASLGLVCRWLDPASAAALGVEAGAQVLSVVPGTAGGAAGIVAGDVVTAIDGQAVDSGTQPRYPSLSDLLRSYGTGTQVTVTVYRAQVSHQLSLTLPAG